MDSRESPKVLLLGISYPDVKGHMDKHGYSEKLLTNKKISVDQAVELVRRGILTEMDARDLARCVATEEIGGGMEAYTVSKEVGGVYRKDRHVYANFNNSRGLYNALTQNFGLLQFQQVILDYYWMPTGWLVTRWNKTLFQNTLPDLVKFKMLAFPGSRSRIRQRSGSDSENVDANADERKEEEVEQDPAKESSIELEEGVVFLPFCAHVCKELVGAIHILKKYFAITFVHKDELPGHALWKGTMEIDANVMQHRLGKRLDQEEIYCTFQPKDIYGSMEDSHINKDDVMKMLLSIDSFEQIRMIRLRPLRQHEPPSTFRDTVIEPEVGGFIGLDWDKGKRRFKEFRSRKKAPLPQPVRRPRSTTTKLAETSDDDSSDSESSSDDDSSIDDVDQRELDGFCEETGAYIDFDFDPYNPERIAETTSFYPCPTLDLVSYVNGKEIVDDDNVMDSWAETWGPKASRKRNKKQDILHDHFQQVKRKQKGHMTCPSRVQDPDADEKEGYRWTLTGDEGWALALNGDAPGFEIIPKVVKRAKDDTAMAASRHLFEMKNPGFKTLSRSYGFSSMLSCYQIPKTSILCKIETAREAERTMIPNSQRESSENAESEEDNGAVFEEEKDPDNSLQEVTSIDTMTVEDVYKLQPRLLKTHLKRFCLEKIPLGTKARRTLLSGLIEKRLEERRRMDRLAFLASVAIVDDGEVQDSALFALAEMALDTPPMPEEAKKIVKEAICVTKLVTEDDLPPFKAAFQHMYFNLQDTDGFPNELFQLVQRAEAMLITHIISWQPKGKSFAVHDKGAFEKKILKICSGSDDVTYACFLITLRKFGFVEIQEGSRKGGFRHEYFRRRSPEDVALIFAHDEDSSDDIEMEINDAAPKKQAEPVTNNVSNRKGRGSASKKATNAEKVSEPKNYDLTKNDRFPAELYRLLEDAQEVGLTNVIGWTRGSGGKIFSISDEEQFITKVLSPNSKKPLLSSFEASLFAFGFKKTRSAENDRRYRHPNFKKGHPELALLITSDKIGNRDLQRTPGKGHGGATSGVKESLPFLGRPDFVESLRLLLDSKGDQLPIKWVSDGAAFSVNDTAQFESKIMPQYFKSMCYSAFRRELKLFGFEPVGSSADLKRVMFHGLFHRDFPDLWKLRADESLEEKVLYRLSIKLQQEAPTPQGAAMGATLVLDNKGEWIDWPDFKQLLLDSIRQKFDLLYLRTGSQQTKSQKEYFVKLSSDMLSILAAKGIVSDEKVVLPSIRAYFKSLFRQARKELQSMKTSSGTNQEWLALNALVLKAQSEDFSDYELVATMKRKASDAPGSTVESDEPPEVSAGKLEERTAAHADSERDVPTGPTEKKHALSRKRGSVGQKPDLKKRKTGDPRGSSEFGLSVLSPGFHPLKGPTPEKLPENSTASDIEQRMRPSSTENPVTTVPGITPDQTILRLLHSAGAVSERPSTHTLGTFKDSVETDAIFVLDSAGRRINGAAEAIEEVKNYQTRKEVCAKS